MHSTRKEQDINERVSSNPYVKGPGYQSYGGGHNRGYNGGGRDMGAQPYYGGQQPRGHHREPVDEEKIAAKFLSFRAFCTSEEPHATPCVTPEEFQKAYLTYKDDFQMNYVRKMVKIESTFKSKVILDRAKTSCVLSRFSQRQAIAQQRSAHFGQLVVAGAFKDINLMAPPLSSDGIEMIQETNSGLNAQEVTRIIKVEDLNGDADMGELKLPEGLQTHAPLVIGPTLVYLDADANSVVMRELPNFVSRDDVVDYLKKHNLLGGLAELEVTYDNISDIRSYWANLGQASNAPTGPQLVRSVRVQFVNQTFAEEAVTAMQGRPIVVPASDGEDEKSYTVHPILLAPCKELRVRILPGCFAHPDVVELDLALTQELLSQLDSKFGITFGENGDAHPVLHQDVTTLSYQEKLVLLDLRTTYLAFVHNMDFFGCRMEASTCNLVAASSPLTDEKPFHLSVRPYLGSLDEGLLAALTKLKDESSVKLRRHETSIRNLIQSIHEPFPQAIDADHPDVQAEWESFIQENIVHAESNRARCGVCEKLFKGPDFVTKHIQNKHFDAHEKAIERVDHRMSESRFLEDKLNLFLLKLPVMDEHGGSSRDQQLARRDEYGAVGGPVRRGHPGWNSNRNAYRDWDAPTVTVGRQTQGFRKLTNYDDL